MNAAVQDDGPGIPEEKVDSAASLGLQSIKERAALLGGTCRILSAESTGTKVVVTVPLTQGNNGGLKAAPTRLLVADDHTLFREGIIEICRTQRRTSMWSPRQRAGTRSYAWYAGT